MPCDIQIYSPKGSKALSFVLEFIFDEFYGCGYQLVSEIKELRPKSCVINYSNEMIDGAIQIAPCGYLLHSDLRKFPKIEISEWNGLPTYFNTSGTLPFDIFASIFFLLSRAEEYGSGSRDSHGRFQSKSSVFTSDFIFSDPIIDEWLIAFRRQLLLGFDISFTQRKFKWINTYDIDVAYAYRYRSIFHAMGAAGRNVLRGDFKSFMTRFRVLYGNETDPYDTYAFQKEISEKYADESIYFFLLANKSKYDRNLDHSNIGMKALIKSAEVYAKVGIHPSYVSNENPRLLSAEIKRLSKIVQSPIKYSRQHFLRMQIPSTYQELLENAIAEDYTMGYAELPGFRSGTCTPHYFFDIEKNKKTELKLFPLVLMDGSLRDYLKLDSLEARVLTQKLIEKVKAVNGTFISLWHNDSLIIEANNYLRELYVDMAKAANAK